MVDSARYTDAAWLQVEKERIFMRSWVPAAGAWKLNKPGDYVVFEELDQSILLVRGPHEVKAFRNHCRHRGSVLLTGSGRVNGIRCPYHGWSYDLNGSLRSVPLPDGVQTDATGLLEVPTTRWAGLHWVNLGSDQTLKESLGPDLHGELLPYQYEDMVPVEERIWELPVNWKAFLENVTDFYHVPFVHKNSIAGMVSEPPDLHSYGDHTRQRLDVASYGWRGKLDAHCSRGGPYNDTQLAALHKYIVFPSVCLNVLPYHFTIMATFPVAPNKTRLWYAFCRRRGGSPIERARAVATWAASRAILYEDVVMLTRYQEGLMRGPRHDQPLHELENATAHLQDAVTRWCSSS
jgi:phenylpropionate dioxygenase-like ring-hydroxylating dioxygenase large terminal subunit